jgi:hypothetical protein
MLIVSAPKKQNAVFILTNKHLSTGHAARSRILAKNIEAEFKIGPYTAVR